MQDKRNLLWDIEPPPTCPLCDKMDELYPFTLDGTRRKKVKLEGKAYDKQSAILNKHPKCKTCWVFLGGTHSGGSVEEAEKRNGMCKNCERRNNENIRRS